MRYSGGSPFRKGKKMVGGCFLSVGNSVRLLRCGKVVDGLMEMESIVKSLKLERFDYILKALA
jgi:hypothetical protein